MLRHSPSSSPHLPLSSPPLSACGVMITLFWFGSGLLPAAFHTSPGNDWNWRWLFSMWLKALKALKASVLEVKENLNFQRQHTHIYTYTWVGLLIRILRKQSAKVMDKYWEYIQTRTSRNTASEWCKHILQCVQYFWKRHCSLGEIQLKWDLFWLIHITHQSSRHPKNSRMMEIDLPSHHILSVCLQLCWQDINSAVCNCLWLFPQMILFSACCICGLIGGILNFQFVRALSKRPDSMHSIHLAAMTLACLGKQNTAQYETIQHSFVRSSVLCTACDMCMQL